MKKSDLVCASILAQRLGEKLSSICPADCDAGVDYGCPAGYVGCLILDITTIRTSLEDKIQKATENNG